MASEQCVGPAAKRWHTPDSGSANSPAFSAGGRSDIPPCRRPVAGRLLADLAGTTAGKSYMVSSGPRASWMTHVTTSRAPTAQGHVRIDGSLLESTGGSILASAEGLFAQSSQTAAGCGMEVQQARQHGALYRQYRTISRYMSL